VAYEQPKAFYRQPVETTAFQQPLAWADLRPGDYDALLLPGGHAPGMRQYLSSTVLADSPRGGWAATTEPIRRTSRTRSQLP
jgi:hypothetical protein